ncbi:PucR family transcriptional regulator ligand-binding domain-containing protein [Paenibacillus qinlingensis]|uniref:Purine catabolism regulator n=1 Tax=Paenibacillus qinlingensis TaxID=1837343 RepID=A0ABU1NZG6_9BACL|nr:PucR family transcriptional regulator ligand-binding domain-containing protein [Paenibacillus qinlingensis]MDR6552694.1 purine catabolism regulator [Paenibacillus qinlingensis]
MVQTLLQLTVQDILQRPLFSKAEAIATEEALARKVRWVHIMEVTQVGHLLNGNELILSTGIGWHDKEETSLSFLQQLIDSGASGLCIELGTYTKQPLESMKELALQANFPLIFFHEEVRYIDITQDLHTHFIHQHHKMVSDLESLSTKLNQLLLSGKGLLPLLQLLQETTQVQVAFFPFDTDAVFVPSLPKEAGAAFYEKWIFGELFHLFDIKNKLAHRPILALEHLFADLLLFAEQELSEFQILALDRCATAIAQEMMRTTYIEEKTRYKQDLWVTDWLGGKHSLPDIRDYVMSVKPAVKLGPIIVCVFDKTTGNEGSKSQETLLFQKQMLARSLFEREGFYLFPTVYEQRIVFILLDQLPSGASHERILRTIQRLQKSQETHLFPALIGIGKSINDPLQLRVSYDTAIETLVIQKDVGILPKPFYHELHVYKILLLMKQSGQLTSIIEEYLGGLLLYDREKNGQLLKTLHMYLTLSGSKQETAKELFIVRQTLYHRLDKIAAILGDDFMQPQKRMALELALHGYEYLNGAIQSTYD